MKKNLLILIFIFSFQSAFSQMDTVKTYFDRSSSFHVYKYKSANDGKTYPLTGTNDVYSMLGSRFIFSGQARIAGALIAFAQKKHGSLDNLAVVVYHLKMDGNPPSGKAHAIGFFKVNQIDTNSTTPVFTYIPFTKDTILTSNFSIMVATIGPHYDDSFSIFTNSQGDGQMQKTVFDMYLDINYNQVYENLYDLPIETNIGEKPDIDLMIVPVLDYSTGINESFSFSGITIKNIYPNPTNDKFSIEININEPTYVELSLVASDGMIVKTINNDFINIGDNTFEVNTKEIPSSDYFYIIKTNRGKFAGKISVVR